MVLASVSPLMCVQIDTWPEIWEVPIADLQSFVALSRLKQSVLSITGSVAFLNVVVFLDSERPPSFS